MIWRTRRASTRSDRRTTPIGRRSPNFRREYHHQVEPRAVALTGFVPNYFQKVVAEQIARSVSGVRALTNDIEVTASNRFDPAFARCCQNDEDMFGRGALLQDTFRSTIEETEVTPGFLCNLAHANDNLRRASTPEKSRYLMSKDCALSVDANVTSPRSSPAASNLTAGATALTDNQS